MKLEKSGYCVLSLEPSSFWSISQLHLKREMTKRLHPKTIELKLRDILLLEDETDLFPRGISRLFYNNSNEEFDKVVLDLIAKINLNHQVSDVCPA